MIRFVLLALLVLTPLAAFADESEPAVHLSRFGEGAGPAHAVDVFRLLDSERTKGQSNAAAFDREHEGAHESFILRASMRVLEGGDGGAFVFLNTREYGVRGPAPFLQSWVEPNLRRSFAVGVDVHNPPSREQFSPWGNYQDLPQREISLHWDGREIVKRVAPEEFRGTFTDVTITVDFVVGGADVTVKIGAGTVYDRYFVAGMLPYEARVALGAGTREDATTEFDVREVVFEVGEPAKRRRPPLHVEVFNHVLTDNSKTSYTADVTLPPLEWSFGRVIMTIDIHDAGKDWDEWDRNGEVSIWLDDETKLGIVPFITSYRTECHWEVDVTHFRPYLTGKKKIEIAAGTTFYKNRGYMMSMSLDFHHGVPDLAPCEVVPVWVGTAKYTSAENHFQDFFPPKTVEIGEDIAGARLFVTTTGHSQIGEFTPSQREIAFDPDTADDTDELQRFVDVVWKTDVYLNPNRPQFGTWQYSRAGWAPGDVVRPKWIDLTPYLNPGATAGLRYVPEPYDFGDSPRKPDQNEINKASHVVRSYLILYRKPVDAVEAPTLLITNVANDSSAARATIQAGDYLVSYDGVRLDSVDDLRGAIGAAAASGKDTVPVVMFRGSERLELEIETGRMGINLASR